MATILLIISFGLFVVYHAFFKESDSADLGGTPNGSYNTLDMSHDDNEEQDDVAKFIFKGIETIKTGGKATS